MEYNQPTIRPVPKVESAAAGGAAATLLIFLASLGGVTLDPTVAAAIVTVVAFVAAYVRKDVK